MRNRAGAISLGCLVWVAVIAAVAYFGSNVAEVWFKNSEYQEAMVNEIRVRGKLPDWQLRNRFKIIADSLGLPEDAGIVTIQRVGGRITVSAHYEQTVDMPGFKKDLHFEPKAAMSY